MRIMEVCGGQTHAIMRHGLDTLLPPHIQLLHGPGCPVCVTPARYLDQAIAIARQPDTIVTTFGDLLRVPSESSGDLFAAKAQGADVRIVTSPLQTLDIAQAHPEKNIVHLAIGFETTAPANAMLAFSPKSAAEPTPSCWSPNSWCRRFCAPSAPTRPPPRTLF